MKNNMDNNAVEKILSADAGAAGGAGNAAPQTPPAKQPDDGRPDWDEYFMEMAEVVRKRSTCLRRKVGALIVKDSRVLATGYNGAPSGIRHCAETGCLREKYNVPSGQRHELCRGIHAEQNAIVQAAYLGVSISDSTLYCTNQPCILCSKMLINAGVKRIVVKEGYPDEAAREMLAEAGLEVEMMGEDSLL